MLQSWQIFRLEVLLEVAKWELRGKKGEIVCTREEHSPH